LFSADAITWRFVPDAAGTTYDFSWDGASFIYTAAGYFAASNDDRAFSRRIPSASSFGASGYSRTRYLATGVDGQHVYLSHAAHVMVSTTS
jgi:hypothetical protein